MKYFLATLALLCTSGPVQAELYIELALEGGGETMTTTTDDVDLNLGGGVKFGAGIQTGFGDNGEITLSLGYLFDSINASNGDAEFDTFSLDAIYTLAASPHRFGLGLTYHLDPEYNDDIDGFAPLTLEFDDTLGFIVQYSYAFNPGLQFGGRFTQMEYEINSVDFDGDSFGLFLSSAF